MQSSPDNSVFIEEIIVRLACFVSLLAVSFCGTSTAQEPFDARCPAILAAAGQHLSLTEVSSIHFQCSVHRELQDGIPDALSKLDLSNDTIRALKYENQSLSWTIPVEDSWADDDQATTFQAVNVLLSNALESGNFLVSEDIAKVTATFKVDFEIKPEEDDDDVPPQQDTPEAEPLPVPMKEVFECVTIYERKVECKRCLFGRTKLVVTCVPRTIQVSKLVPAEPTYHTLAPTCGCGIASSTSSADLKVASSGKPDPSADSVLVAAGEGLGFRSWTNANGETSNALLKPIRAIDDLAVLVDQSGTIYSVPLEMLSGDDRQLFANWAKENAPENAARTYRDRSGKHSAELVLLHVHEGVATFVREDKRWVSVDLNVLHAADRDVIETSFGIKRSAEHLVSK